MTSVVSYPKRCALWGDGRYRGNCDGRLFLGLVLRYGAKSVADPMMGSGTTRDAIAWLNERTQSQVNYWGSDLKEGFDLTTTDLPGKFDFVWLHPPYWDIIRYSQEAADLSTTADYAGFRTRLSACLKRCYTALNWGGRLAVLVGDVRKKGKYTPIVRDLLNLEGELGELQGVLIKVQHACQSDAKNYGRLRDPRIQHEYCVVFRRLE